MGRIKNWCATCGKPEIDCICPRKRRKLKVYYYWITRPWVYQYGAFYNKKQFARATGANLYIMGGSRSVHLEQDSNRIEWTLKHPFTVFYNENIDPIEEEKQRASQEKHSVRTPQTSKEKRMS